MSQIAAKINLSHEIVKQPRGEDHILQALDNLWHISQREAAELAQQLKEAESKEQLVRHEMQKMRTIHEEEQKSVCF